MRPCSSATSTPSSMVLNSVSRKLRSRASRWTTLCNPSVSSRPMRPSTLSRKLDLLADIGENQLNQCHNGTFKKFVKPNKEFQWHSQKQSFDYETGEYANGFWISRCWNGVPGQV